MPSFTGWATVTLLPEEPSSNRQHCLFGRDARSSQQRRAKVLWHTPEDHAITLGASIVYSWNSDIAASYRQHIP